MKQIYSLFVVFAVLLSTNSYSQRPEGAPDVKKIILSGKIVKKTATNLLNMLQLPYSIPKQIKLQVAE